MFSQVACTDTSSRLRSVPVGAPAPMDNNWLISCCILNRRWMGGPESVVKSKAASSGAPVETHLPGPQAVQCSLDSLAEAEHMHLLRYGDHSA